MSIKEIIKMAHNYGCLYESTLSEVYSEETLLKDLKKELTLTDVSKRSELLLFRKWQEENWNNVYLYEDKFMVDTYLDKK